MLHTNYVPFAVVVKICSSGGATLLNRPNYKSVLFFFAGPLIDKDRNLLQKTTCFLNFGMYLQTSRKDLLALDFEGVLKYFRVHLPKKYRSEEAAKELLQQAVSLKVWSYSRLKPQGLVVYHVHGFKNRIICTVL